MHRHLVGAAGIIGAAEVVAGHRPLPTGGAGVRQEPQLQRGDVAVAHPARALRHRPGQQRPVDAAQQPAEAITTPAGHGHRRRRRGHAVDGGQAGIVVAGKASGKLRTGRHLVCDPGTPLCSLWLTMLEAAGVKSTKLGDATTGLRGV